MKNNKIIYFVIIIMLVMIITNFLDIKKYRNENISDNILNKKWYNYDPSNGYYNVATIGKTSFEFIKPQNNNISSEYDGCNKYYYNQKERTLDLTCGKKIKIEEINENSISLTLNEKEKTFFGNPSLSLNFEFENYFKKSMSEYKNNLSQTTELIKIKYDGLIDILKSDENAKFVFIGDKCTSVDCFLAYDVLDKWIFASEDVYFINPNEFTDKQLLKINEINEDFSIVRDDYNDIYPKILVVQNSKTVDKYEIKCNGFDCSMYYNN